MQTSMQFTIGTALSRAHDEGHGVEVLVEGHWLTGRIVGSDSMGVVLEDGPDHCVVRLERITAVRVRRGDDLAASGAEQDARPMPGPRHTTLVADVA
ncbi:MAG: hypothetical protein ACJ72E_02600 [Marmoricola sp.]